MPTPKKQAPAPRQAVHAAQIWPLLIWAAKNNQILTYGKIGNWLGVDVRNVRGSLGAIKRYCSAKKYPALTVIVVKQSTGLPIAGAIDDVLKPKKNTPKEKKLELERIAKLEKLSKLKKIAKLEKIAMLEKIAKLERIAKEQMKVFTYSWMKKNPPTISELKTERK